MHLTRPFKCVSPKVKKTCFSDVVSFHINISQCLSFILHTYQNAGFVAARREVDPKSR